MVGDAGEGKDLWLLTEFVWYGNLGAQKKGRGLQSPYVHSTPPGFRCLSKQKRTFGPTARFVCGLMRIQTNKL